MNERIQAVVGQGKEKLTTQGETMKTEKHRKKWEVGFAMLVLAGLASVSAVQAADKGSLTVTIRPNAAYSLTIGTSAQGEGFLNLGLVDLSGTTQTVRPATVTVTSNFAATDLKLQGAITCTGTPCWQFDAATGAAEPDYIAVWAVFTDTGVATAPSQTGGQFSGSAPAGAAGADVVSTTDEHVGDNGSNTDLFQVSPGQGGYKDMEDQPSNTVNAGVAASHLWTYFRMPNATTNSDNEFITFIVTAVAPN